MRNDTSHAEETASGPVRTAVRTLGRALGDLIAITLWVLFLTLLFLETGWPRWAFYALLLAGVGGYVTVTAVWID